MNVIIMGPQGCGKGTQAKLIAEKFNFKHISTGDLFRKGVKEGDAAALRLKEFVDKGLLFPDDVAIELIKKNLSTAGNIFDGFPRTLTQAESLDEITQIDLVIELNLSEGETIARLSSRRQCKLCGEIYGAKNLPKKKGVCDVDGGDLFQRDDDKPEAIKVRLDKYSDETEPLLEYYKPRNIVHSVEGSKTIDEIFADICDVIENFGV